MWLRGWFLFVCCFYTGQPLSIAQMQERSEIQKLHEGLLRVSKKERRQYVLASQRVTYMASCYFWYTPFFKYFLNNNSNQPYTYPVACARLSEQTTSGRSHTSRIHQGEHITFVHVFLRDSNPVLAHQPDQKHISRAAAYWLITFLSARLPVVGFY